MNVVYWSFITTHILGCDHLNNVKPLLQDDYVPFKSLSKEIVAKRKGVTFLKCPAHTDYLKNTFVFCAPFDLIIDIEIDNKENWVKIFSENLSQEIFDSLIDTRFLFDEARGLSDFPLIGIDWLPVFTADSPTMVQVTPAFMHYNDFTNKTAIVPGEYDISKWTRPIETVFEVKTNKERIVIKQGDAVSYIKFITDDIVKLEKRDTPWSEISQCNDIVNSDKFRPLKERYAAFESKKSCPLSRTK
jgi:hypothetical protein